MTITVQQATPEDFDELKTPEVHGAMSIRKDGVPFFLGGIKPSDVGYMAWSVLDHEVFVQHIKTVTRVVRAYLNELPAHEMSVFMNARGGPEVEWGKRLGFTPITRVIHPITGQGYWLMKKDR